VSGPGLDVEQFRTIVVRPTLRFLDPEIPYSEAAELLMVGTAMQESRLRFLDQLTPGPGPAYGLFQMEARTHADHIRWLDRPENAGLRAKVEMLLGDKPDRLLQLRTNLAYACAMSRVHYWRVREGLPEAADARGELARARANVVSPPTPEKLAEYAARVAEVEARIAALDAGEAR